MSDLGWCPRCEQHTVQEVGAACFWCNATIIRRQRGGWKRPDKTSLINEASARAIHAKYSQGVSARKLAQRLYLVLGYKSPATCEAAIGVAFKRYGLPVRDRIAATVLASTKNGLSPRNDQERRRRRREAGLTSHMQERQPQCAAVKLQPPRKGERCTRPAMEGCEYCCNHDPARRDETVARLHTMRERLPVVEHVAFAGVFEQLEPLLAGADHPPATLSRATGVAHATCSRLLKHRPERITVTLAGRLLAPLEERRAA